MPSKMKYCVLYQWRTAVVENRKMTHTSQISTFWELNRVDSSRLLSPAVVKIDSKIC